jgi:hypothetical protein
MGKQKLKYILTLTASLFVVLTVSTAPAAFAANTPTLNQTINAGVLSADILDEGGNSVGSPSFTMTAKNLAFTCQSGGSASTGILGGIGSRIYVINPSGANNGWTLTMGATSGATAVWTSGGNTFDFNDAGTGGCTDAAAADTDTKAGQLTVDPSVGTLATACTACTTANVTKGTSTAYLEGTTDSVTLLNASAASDDVWRGNLIGTSLSQTIPAETPSGSYTLNMTLTATAL